MLNKFNSQLRTSQERKIQAQIIFLVNSIKFKEEKSIIPHNLFRKTEKEEILPKSFYGVSVDFSLQPNHPTPGCFISSEMKTNVHSKTYT